MINAPLRQVKGFEHVIKLIHENPKRFYAYPTSPVNATEIDLRVTDMLVQGLIRKSNSLYATPVILREKPNREWRFITNFSHITSLFVADCYPMTRIQQILKSLGNANYITKLDPEKGYWEVPMVQIPRSTLLLEFEKAL